MRYSNILHMNAITTYAILNFTAIMILSISLSAQTLVEPLYNFSKSYFGLREDVTGKIQLNISKAYSDTAYIIKVELSNTEPDTIDTNLMLNFQTSVTLTPYDLQKLSEEISSIDSLTTNTNELRTFSSNAGGISFGTGINMDSLQLFHYVKSGDVFIYMRKEDFKELVAVFDEANGVVQR